MLDKVLMTMLEVDIGLRPSPSPSHYSSDHGRSYGFYSYNENRSVHRSQTSHLSAYNHGGLSISHQSFTQEALPRGVHGVNIHQNHPYYSYPRMPTP